MKFFQNQDWVWGLGLIISGTFFAMGVIRFGVNKFRKQFINVIEGDMRTGIWFNYVLKYLIPLEALLLIFWWFFQSIGWNPQGWYNPFRTDSLGTCIFQWVLAIIILLGVNRIIVKKMEPEKS